MDETQHSQGATINMTKRHLQSVSAWVLFSVAMFFSCGGWAFNEPPINLSATTFLDGGAPQGLYYLNYGIFSEGKTAIDNNGKEIPGKAKVNALVNLHQFYYVSKLKFLGASVALDVAVPLAAVTMKGQLPGPSGFIPLAGNTAGLGDFLIGPALQWDGHTFLGKPVFHRIESDWTFPTGKYDKGQMGNPGANLLTVDSYYSFVWFFHPKWETSWRLWYAFNGENKDDPRGALKPGQLFHVNYAASYALSQQWRVGAAGYYLKQTTDDRIGGIKVMNSRERAIGFGPGIAYLGQGYAAFLSHPVEFGVRNRFKGSRTTLQIIHKF
jgi:hypothetical protein